LAGRATRVGGFQEVVRLELTKEQQALILQNTGMEAKELELTDNALGEYAAGIHSGTAESGILFWLRRYFCDLGQKLRSMRDSPLADDPPKNNPGLKESAPDEPGRQ
jgi:hypothetical protein